MISGITKKGAVVQRNVAFAIVAKRRAFFSCKKETRKKETKKE
jgi:hypothetical protein